MNDPEALLPRDLLSRATLRGREYAWPVEDIVRVIDAAKAADLVSMGGQLQFRFPDGSVCECYWVEVDTFETVPADLPWEERVARTAQAASSEFRELRDGYDFMEEGRRAFADEFARRVAEGDDPAAAMCFVWYLAARPETEDAGVA